LLCHIKQIGGQLMGQNEHIVKLLEEIRDNQKEHLKTYKEFVGKYS